MKYLSETNDNGEGLVQNVVQKIRVTTQAAPIPKRAKIVQPAPTVKESVIPSTIPRRIKTRATKANPKFGEKEWMISFTSYK